uniref:Endoplasmic reticulum junction formation protein lunapark n=1 Tax=Schistosoma haematobium TaxID=6185 RepID=A0A095C1N5_SCHHA
MFTRRVNKTNEKLKKLRADKQKLVQEVMEKETFNKAQQILKRFDPLTFASIAVEEKKTPKPVFGSMINLVTPHSEVRRRNNSGDKHLTPGLLGSSLTAQSSTPMVGSNQTLYSKKPRLLRPLLPRERSIIDKVLDALVGDGPDKRFALICNECSSHNGMALQEEFEYLARSTRLKTGLSTENIENTNDLLNNSKTTPSLLSTKSNLKRMNEAIQRSSTTNLYSHDSDDNDSVLGNNETVVCDSHEISTNTFNEQLNLKDSADVDKFRESME